MGSSRSANACAPVREIGEPNDEGPLLAHSFRTGTDQEGRLRGREPPSRHRMLTKADLSD